MKEEATPGALGSNAGLGPLPKRADVAAVMTLVWALVRSGPNFDGRHVDVERAVKAAIDNAVAADRERIINALPGGHSVDPQWVADMVRWPERA